MSISICLFGSLMEAHVNRSLHQALKNEGCQILSTGPVWGGHDLPKDEGDIEKIRNKLHLAIDQKIDVLFVIRAAALPPKLVREAKAKGVFTVVWLPDDPVLYDFLYKHVVDEYDLVLNCGSKNILDFYTAKGHQPGINFPFWTSSDFFPYCYNPEKSALDVVFWGNCTGAGRKARYETIAALPARTRTFGRIGDDPMGLHGGVIKDINNTEKLVSKTFCNFKIGLNIPQHFSDYADSVYSFKGLEKLGSFQIPSRVVQYAASGMPILSFGNTLNGLLPGAICVNSQEEAAKKLEVLRDADRLLSLSREVHASFKRFYSATIRAKFLLALLDGSLSNPYGMSSEKRARLFFDAADTLACTKSWLTKDAPTKKSNVTIAGYYGRENLGDELILQSMVNNVDTPDASVEFTVAAEDPKNAAAMHGLRTIPRHELDKSNEEARRSSSLVLGGGGLWHDYSFEAQGGIPGLFSPSPWSITGYGKLPLMWAIHNRPVHVYGVGVGPLDSDDARSTVRFLGEQATTISVRDESSRKLLLSIPGWSKSVNLFPDPVFALDLAPYQMDTGPLQDGKITLGINLRQWPYHDLEPLMNNLAAAITSLSETTPVKLVGIPLQTNADTEMIQNLFRRLPPTATREMLAKSSHSTTIQAISRCSAMISMRLHACILSWRLGVPTAGFAYDTKVKNTFDQLGVPEACLPIEPSLPQLTEAILRIVQSPKDLIQKTTPELKTVEQQSRNGLSYLRLWLKSGSGNIPFDENMAQK